MPYNVFAIRVMGTEKYIPALGRNRRRGGSRLEPEINGGLNGIRLFSSAESAINFIGQWRKGIHERVMEYYEGVPDGDSINIVEVPERKTLELELVVLNLFEIFNVPFSDKKTINSLYR